MSREVTSEASFDAARGVTDDRAARAMVQVEEQIVHLVRRARLLWRDAAARVHPDLQPVGYRMLSHLLREGPSNPGRLAELLETDKSVISRQARLLEDLGLLDVQPDPEDGRCRIFVVTPTAHDVLVATRQSAFDRLAIALEGLSSLEVEQFASLLARVNAGFDDEGLGAAARSPLG